MASKAQRQHRIARILEKDAVTSQSQLAALLTEAGITVNQATVSRDLEELGAIKVRVPGGDTVYAIAELPRAQVAPVDHLRRVMTDWVVEADRSGDLVVVATPPGSAHVVASAVDRNGIADVMGTVAGDDTILIIARQGRGAPVLAAIKEMAGID